MTAVPDLWLNLISVVLTERVSVGMPSGYDLVALGRQPHTDWTGRLQSRDHAIVRDALQRAGAAEFASRQVAELSDGERQRIMVARALAQQPSVMVLDEITAFLDLPRRIQVMRLLRELAHDSRTAILLSTHDLDLALRTADRAWLLSAGGRMICLAAQEIASVSTLEEAFGITGLADSVAGRREA